MMMTVPTCSAAAKGPRMPTISWLETDFVVRREEAQCWGRRHLIQE